MSVAELYFKLNGLVNGKRVHIRRDASIMRQALRASDKKGIFLERQLAQDNWLPAFSIESEDGERWHRMRKAFETTLKSVPWRERIPVVTADVCKDYKGGVIDADVIIDATARIMFLIVFDHQLSEDELTMLRAARNEWAKTLAVKGPAVPYLRCKAFAKVEALVRKHHTKPAISGLTEKEWTSVFFQPWLMSPMINFPDLMASVPGYMRANPGTDVLSAGFLGQLLDYEHPFPILERELDRDIDGMRAGEHVFLLLDGTERALRGSHAGLRFGTGSRACPGARVAHLLFAHLMMHLYSEEELDLFQPCHNHHFSGRGNDAEAVTFKDLTLLSMLLFRWGPHRRFQEWASEHGSSQDACILHLQSSVRLAMFWLFVFPFEWQDIALGIFEMLVQTQTCHTYLTILFGTCVALCSPASEPARLLLTAHALKMVLGDLLTHARSANEWGLLLLLVATLSSRALTVSFGINHIGAVAVFTALRFLTHKVAAEAQASSTASAAFKPFCLVCSLIFRLVIYPELLYYLLSESLFGSALVSDAFGSALIRCEIAACFGHRVASAIVCVVARWAFSQTAEIYEAMDSHKVAEAAASARSSSALLAALSATASTRHSTSQSTATSMAASTHEQAAQLSGSAREPHRQPSTQRTPNSPCCTPRSPRTMHRRRPSLRRVSSGSMSSLPCATDGGATRGSNHTAFNVCLGVQRWRRRSARRSSYQPA